MKKYFKTFAISSLLLITFLSCNFFTGAPTPSAKAHPVSTLPPTSVNKVQGPSNLPTESLQNFEKSLKSTVENLKPTDTLKLTITQEQFNAYLVEELAKQPDPLLNNPQVVFINDQVQINGQLQQSGINVDASIFLKPYANNGELAVSVDSMTLGPISAPQSIIDTTSLTINNFLHNSTQSITGGYFVENVAISDGVMILTVRKR
jgi:hypothetical protein